MNVRVTTGLTSGRLAFLSYILESRSNAVAGKRSHDAAKEGTPLVLLAHANGFCKEVWNPVVEELAGLLNESETSEVQLVALDFSGHGLAECWQYCQGYNLYNGHKAVLRCLVEDVSECLNEVAPQSPLRRRKLFGCGHSMGASALVLHELHAPHRFHGLLLVEPILFPMDGPPTGPHPLADRTLRRRTKWPSLDEASSFLRSRPLFAAWDPRALTGYLQGGFGPCPSEGERGVQLTCVPATEAAYYRGSGTTIWPHLHKIATTSPVTVLAGQESTHMDVPGMGGSAAVFSQMVGHMGPLASLAMVPQCSHFLPMERPQAVAERIAALLRANPDAKL